MEEIFLTTDDEIEIRGTFFEPKKPKHIAVIFFHMLRKERSIWDFLAGKLVKLGYPGVSIDLRGHGESDGSWQSFSEQDFRNMVYDAQAAKHFLKEKYNDINFVYIGASIGANLALIDCCEDDCVQACVIISPGLDFHGLRTDKLAKHFNRPYLMIASGNDYYSFRSANYLYEKFATPKSQAKFLKLDQAGHGTNIFETEPQIQEEIIGWVEALSNKV